MTPAMRSSTPPPPQRLHTPPTPKHGFGDHWEPFSPRKSARISAQRNSSKTPPPRNSTSTTNPDPFAPAKATRAQASSSAGMVSPFESPKKKARTSAMDCAASASGPSKASSLAADDKASARRSASATISRTTGMLPTPAKTPRKAPAEKNPAIQGVARNLFAPGGDDALPGPKNARAKKYTGVSLDSFRAEEEPIEIFTDSKERIPEKEVSADNPFYGDAGRVGEEPVLRRSKRRHVHVPGEGRQTVEEAMKREDGLVYVFRGKKTFRKFAEPTDADDDDDGDDSEARSGSTTHRHMTRSSIKPRLLFPPKERSQATLDEEEADTDIEADAQKRPSDRDGQDAETPAGDAKVGTPAAPGYSPAPLPDTRRATRARDKKFDEGTPVKKARGGSSPFDSWPRVKSRSESSVPSKRAGSSLGAATTKKMRS